MNTSSSTSRPRVPASVLTRLASRLFASLLAGLSVLAVSGEPSSVTPPHVITTSDVLVVHAGAAFSYRIVASDAPSSYSASGLPPGLTLDPSTGIIRGVISALSTTPYTVTFRATNVAGTGEATQLMASDGNPPVEMPYVRSVTAPPAGTYHPGDTLTFTFACSVPYGGLTVSGTPRVAVTIGGATKYATFTAVANDEMTFQYAVVNGDDAGHGIAVADTIDANGATLSDRTGLPCALALPPVDTSAVLIAAADPAPSGTLTTQSAATTDATSGPVVDSGAVSKATATTPASTGTNTDRIVNLSSRLNLAGSDAVVGFVLKGSGTKPMLVRAVGPGLGAFGVTNPAPAPSFTLYDGAGAPIDGNQGWSDSASVAAASAAVGAFALPAGSQDAALVTNLAPGAYTAHVSPGGDGVVLVEVYDAATGTPAELANISARGHVGAGEAALVAGFVVSGDTPKRLLIRGVGPALTRFGVTNPLADPVVEVFGSGASTPTAANDNWEQSTDTEASAAAVATVAKAVGAFPLDGGAKDAALLVTLAPGAYTAVVTGAGGATGEGLVEVYDAPAP